MMVKQNDGKTEVGIYENFISTIDLADVTIVPTDNAKNLGFKFDDQLSLNLQLNAVAKKCSSNLRNYYNIAAKLNHKLKVQLVHGGILSAIDYCNAIFGGLSESNLKMLQKLQNSAVRFIFGLKLRDRKHILPYLKKLHFLPVRYRIHYKLALMVFKCLNNINPPYLSELINCRRTNNHSLRLDDDFYLLERLPAPNLKRTDAAFCYSGPQTWNSLPYYIRCQQDLIKFKKLLKTYYFNRAFNGID